MAQAGQVKQREGRTKEHLLVTYFMSGTKGKASGWSPVRELQFWECNTQDLSLKLCLCDIYVTCLLYHAHNNDYACFNMCNMTD